MWRIVLVLLDISTLEAEEAAWKCGYYKDCCFFWDVTPCILVEICHRFGWQCCFYISARRVKMEATGTSETSVNVQWRDVENTVLSRMFVDLAINQLLKGLSVGHRLHETLLLDLPRSSVLITLLCSYCTRNLGRVCVFFSCLRPYWSNWNKLAFYSCTKCHSLSISFSLYRYKIRSRSKNGGQ
jgi:hypothetical protein